MKIFKSLFIVILCIIFFVFIKNIKAEDSTSLSKILSNESLVAITYWNYNDTTLLVTVSSYIKNLEEGKFVGRKLIVYQKINAEFKKVFENDASLDHFLGMFPLGDNSNRFITMWTGGSSYHFNILRIFESKIDFVLESGSHNFPEFVDIDNDGELEILISEGSFLTSTKGKITYPEKTDVYKWDGKSYPLVKTVLWKNRFDALRVKTK